MTAAMNHRGPAAIQGREQIRRIEEISARYDSPNGGLKALIEKNRQACKERDKERGESA